VLVIDPMTNATGSAGSFLQAGRSKWFGFALVPPL
jgi:hypothetical protein